MAIQTDYQFAGLIVAGAYIRIDRLWGNSKEGITALVSVKASKEQVGSIEQFNHHCDYEDGQLWYTLMYTDLKSKFGGTDV